MNESGDGPTEFELCDLRRLEGRVRAAVAGVAPVILEIMDRIERRRDR